MKILVGAFESPIAEVRVDGKRDEGASAAVLALPWSRTPDGSVARMFVVFLHEE